MGWPEHFSVHAGMGSGLLKTPEIAKNILSKLTSEISIPISCKIRLLPKFSDWLNFINLMQSTGIHLIAIHGRTREELSRGFAHWSAIKDVKASESMTIPVYANGDCFSVKDAFELKSYTGWDGILIARGALHNPFIFNDIKENWNSFANASNGEVRKN